MEKTDEQRAEKRLRYRWHARFAGTPKQKALSGPIDNYTLRRAVL